MEIYIFDDIIIFQMDRMSGSNAQFVLVQSIEAVARKCISSMSLTLI